MSDLQNDIVKYRRGELTPKEMHALEKKALSDPFLADALEGLNSISPEAFAQDVRDLNQRILKQKKTILFTPLRIAAGVILIAASVFVFYQLVPKNESIALNKEKVKEKEAAPKTEPAKQAVEQPVAKTESKKNEPALKPVIIERKAHVARPTAGTEKTDRDETAEGETKIENQPTVAQTQDFLTPETKTEESKLVAKDQAPVSIAMEPVQEVKEDVDLKKSARALSTAKKAKLSEAASGAAVAKQDQLGPRTISGKVVSAEDGSPLPGVNVVVEGTTEGTVTNVDGNFTIQVTNSNQRLVFSFIGLQTQEINTEDKNKLDISMKTDGSQLSEVVVTAVGAVQTDNADETVIHLANPEIGKTAYNKYLAVNLKYPEEAYQYKIKGKVIVEISVLADGRVASYKVVKSLGHGCDEEAIRLIKDGPAWSPTTENGRPIDSKVRVNVKFDPAKAGR